MIYEIDVKVLKSEFESYKMRKTKELKRWLSIPDTCNLLGITYAGYHRICKVGRVSKRIMTYFLEAGFDDKFIKA